MDDTKFLMLTLMLTLTLLEAPAFSAEVEYIGPEQQHKLEQTFTTATYSYAKNQATVQAGHWNCEMFGVRSRMQVQRDLGLYKWTSTDNGKTLHNDGAQVVSEYKVTGDVLVGVHDKFEDQVKVTSDGRLISRLSILAPTRTVVAYSLCQSL